MSRHALLTLARRCDVILLQQLEDLTRGYVDLFKQKRHCDEQEMFDILTQYREDQQDLIRRREEEKLRSAPLRALKGWANVTLRIVTMVA